MSDKPRILVVDDEPQLTRVLRTGLTSRGYDVRAAADGLAGFETFTDWHPDLVITDLAMPVMDGLELCRRVRAISQVPIIVLSAKGEEKTKVEALDLGADDYITKPFGIDELLARVRASLRRAVTVTPEPESTVLTTGDFHIDLETRKVLVADRSEPGDSSASAREDSNATAGESTREVHLTPKEFDLLVYFVKHSGKVLTHRTLLAAIWGGNYVEQNEYLRVFVGNLRKKLEPDPANPRYILTEPWIGYRFNAG
jgi:two-component system KDP operon response regulator KdpE